MGGRSKSRGVKGSVLQGSTLFPPRYPAEIEAGVGWKLLFPF